MVFSADRRNRTSAIAGPSLQLSCSRQVDQRPDLGSSPIGAAVRLPQKSSGGAGAREGVPWLPRITPPPRFEFFATASTIRLPCERFDDVTVDLGDDKGCACKASVKTVPKSVIEKCTTQTGSYSPLGGWPNGDQGGTHGHRDVAETGVEQA